MTDYLGHPLQLGVAHKGTQPTWLWRRAFGEAFCKDLGYFRWPIISDIRSGWGSPRGPKPTGVRGAVPLEACVEGLCGKRELFVKTRKAPKRPPGESGRGPGPPLEEPREV